MHVAAHLDIDLLALNAEEEVTCLLNLTASVAAKSLNRPGQTLVIVLDRSGSMMGPPLEGAKTAIRQLVHRLAPQDAFGLVVFDDNASVISPVRTMAEHHMPSLQAAIAAVEPGNSTDISSGYLVGLREAKRSLAHTGQRGATVLVLSDGDANMGLQEPAQLAALALNALRSDGITTSTLGLGEYYNELLLAALTHGGSGEHRFAPTVDAAVAELASTVGDLLDKSAVGVQLRITRQFGLVSQVSLRNDLPAFIDDDAIIVSLGDMFGGEERSVLMKFGVPGLPTLGTATIAHVVLEYTALPELTAHTVTLPISVNVVPGDEARDRVPNPVVEVAGLLANVAQAKRQVGDDLRAGRTASAEHLLARNLHEVDAARNRVRGLVGVDPSLVTQLHEAAGDLRDLANVVAEENAQYSSKMVMQSFSAQSRGRRQRAPRPAADPDDAH